MKQPISKILIIAPSWVGDMVMAQSLLKVIKYHNPSASISVLAPKYLCTLLERMPEITEIIPSPFLHGELKLTERFAVAKGLRNAGYQQAIILPNSFKSALIPFWAKIPLRTGWRGEMRYILLNDLRILDSDKLPLMVQRYAALGIAEKSGASKITESAEIAAFDDFVAKGEVVQGEKSMDEGAAGTSITNFLPRFKIDDNQIKAALQRLNITNTDIPIMALCVGAEYGPSKRWPEKYFASIANKAKEIGWQVWIFGGPKDQLVAHDIQQQCTSECVDLTGKTTLSEAVDLLSLARVVVTNDSGLMHIAAALDLPGVAIYGASSPRFTPPLNNKIVVVQSDLPCSPCFKRQCPYGHFACLQKITPEMIWEKIK
jgi:heptosyltransferase II